MSGIIRNYKFGVGGVDLVTDPLKLGQENSNEATQLQNAELVPDESKGGAEVLSKRGGLVALNGSAMSGSVLGILGWPLKTTFTRTYYAARGTASANTFKTSSDGITWTNTSTPSAIDPDSDYTDKGMTRNARRIGTFRNYIVYPSSNMSLFDGTTTINIGTAGTGAFGDVLVTNGYIYFAFNEPASASPATEGAVYSVNLDTGAVRQIATAFGTTADNKMDGGGPACLAWYQGQLWVGLNSNSTTDGIGKVVRCYPEVDTTWTADVSNLSGSVCSLRAYRGALYAGTMSSISSAEKVYLRSPTAGTYSASFTGVGSGGNAHIGHLVEYGNELYAAQYHATAPTIHIKKWDGTTWTTDRDVDSSDSGVAGNLPGGSLVGNNSDLFFIFRHTAAGSSDGFILRKSGGSWTKVSTDNYLGPIATLVTRS